MKNLKSVSVLALLLISFSACNNDDAPVNEEEVITTISVTLTGGGQTITLVSKDLDGDGPNDPEVTVSGNLVAGTTYLGTTSFLNELANPAEDITEEVEEEGKDHQIFYQLASNIGTVTYDDVDADGNPIGIEFTLVAGTASTGDLTVTLRHLPNKSASGVANGDITNAGGSTDAEETFSITVVD
jgi:hypothetical protein